MRVKFRSDLHVMPIVTFGSDDVIAKIGKVLPPDELEPKLNTKRRIRFMLREKHGSPFEMGFFLFYIEVPLFCMVQILRHRVGFSFNVESARYKVLKAQFYQAAINRPMKKAADWKPYAQTFEPSIDVWLSYGKHTRKACQQSWWRYDAMLREGVPNELARGVLGPAVYTSAYVACNPRSLMNFLSKRTRTPRSKVKSFVQWETERVAEQFEAAFKSAMPHTAKMFDRTGRVAP